MTLPAPLDCSKETQLIPVMIAPPVTLSQGLHVTLTDTDGNSFSVGKTEPVTLEAGGKHDTDDARSSFVTELVFCGDNMVYMIDAGLANETTYKDAVTWSWDATEAAAVLGWTRAAATTSTTASRWTTARKLLCTSLLQLVRAARHRHEGGAVPHHGDSQRPTRRNCCPATASSWLVPEAKVLGITLYNFTTSRSPTGFSTSRRSARRTASCGTKRPSASMRSAARASRSTNSKTGRRQPRRSNWKKTVQTPQGGLHDMSYVNSNTLCIGGRRAYLYDIGANRFTEMMLFSASTAIKSINYNDETGELWYTDSTQPRGLAKLVDTDHPLLHTDKNASTETRTIKVPDLDVYKVRVMNW